MPVPKPHVEPHPSLVALCYDMSYVVVGCRVAAAPFPTEITQELIYGRRGHTRDLPTSAPG